MTNSNYGSGGYGLDGGGGRGITTATGLSGYGGIAQLVAKYMAQNAGGAVDDSHKQNDEVNLAGRRDVNSEHQSPFGINSTLLSQAIPGAEKALPANNKPLSTPEGSFTAAPTSVDSGAPAYRNSAMSDYLNYMKYRGGY